MFSFLPERGVKMKKQYRFLTMGALMGLLLTGVMPQAQAQDLDGTQFGVVVQR